APAGASQRTFRASAVAAAGGASCAAAAAASAAANTRRVGGQGVLIVRAAPTAQGAARDRHQREPGACRAKMAGLDAARVVPVTPLRRPRKWHSLAHELAMEFRLVTEKREAGGSSKPIRRVRCPSPVSVW